MSTKTRKAGDAAAQTPAQARRAALKKISKLAAYSAPAVAALLASSKARALSP